MLSIVPMQATDIAGVLELEKDSLSAWSKKHLEDELEQPAGFQFIARDRSSENIVAWLCGRIAADECEILKLAVDPGMRRKGFASELLNYGLEHCRRQSVKHCYLEFRAFNAAARQLYEKCGFVVAGRRKNYYQSPKEDAILMQRQL